MNDLWPRLAGGHRVICNDQITDNQFHECGPKPQRAAQHPLSSEPREEEHGFMKNNFKRV